MNRTIPTIDGYSIPREPARLCPALPVVRTSAGTLEELQVIGQSHGDCVDVLEFPWASERMLELVAVISGRCPLNGNGS